MVRRVQRPHRTIVCAAPSSCDGNRADWLVSLTISVARKPYPLALDYLGRIARVWYAKCHRQPAALAANKKLAVRRWENVRVNNEVVSSLGSRAFAEPATA